MVKTTAIKSKKHSKPSFGTYTTTNHFAHECGMKGPIDFATNQPNVFYRRTWWNWWVHGKWRNRIKIEQFKQIPNAELLQQRPFQRSAIGRGAVDSVTESNYNKATLFYRKSLQLLRKQLPLNIHLWFLH